MSARFAPAVDASPPRLHIEVPRPGALESGVLYTCKTCEGGPDVPDPVSINVTSCLFRRHAYGQATLDAARKVHPCRYFDEPHLAHVCSLLGETDVRRRRCGR